MILSRTMSNFKGSLSSRKEKEFSTKALKKISTTPENKPCLTWRWTRALRKLPLEKLVQVNLEEEWLNILVKEWSTRLKTHESFRLVGLEFSLCSIRAFSEMLKKNQSLKSLFLSDHSIDDQCLQILSEGISENVSLLELNFSNNSLGDEGIAALADSLEKNMSIRSVELQDNLIGDLGAESLTSVLEIERIEDRKKGSSNLLNMLNSLEYLNLSRNDIGYFGATALVRAVLYKDHYLSSIPMHILKQGTFSNTCSLDMLDLRDNPITQKTEKKTLLNEKPLLKKAEIFLTKTRHAGYVF